MKTYCLSSRSVFQAFRPINFDDNSSRFGYDGARSHGGGGMLVRYWLATSPITIAADMNLEDALDLMRRRGIRRLPVMRGNRICGILAMSDLYPYLGPHILDRAALPEVVRAELRNTRVADVMSSPPITCDRNAPLEDVGTLMRKHKIGAVPVVHGEELVGIITESDLLAALSDVTQMGADGRRICFRIPVDDKINIFYRIVSLCEQKGVEILTLLTHPLADDSHLVMIRVRGSKVPEFIDALWSHHYEVLASTPK